ncbi:helix-turn-helix domain-containing protein [Neolewinella antarctica]|uniref:AraC-like DNA-binding protein n=1 Tax=Neolewinella antarctica TaxID=442734 RepID=A0ABX0XF61_9BACT|nr:AraC family transcriptional regulator [Neolewinella antarctica]NJC27755.1 AraC-like DNA-binding protein [Neolewinella antarctica]
MLKLREDPRSEHVREMALHFGAELDEGNDAATITMDNERARGFISSYRIFDGLTVWVYNVTFFEDFAVDLALMEGSPYYFSYNVAGHFLHRFGEQKTFARVLPNQHMIFASGPESSVQIVFPANEKLKIAVVIVDLEQLGELDVRNAKRIHKKVGTIFSHAPEERPYRHLGSIDTEAEQYAAIVCENDSVDLVGGLLTEGAVLNMLACQIRAYDQDQAGRTVPSVLTTAELSKITSLGAYVLDNLDDDLTIAKLSRHYRLSSKKLQLGVRHLYGDSVGRYVSNLRMGHAKHLLQSTERNVSEVCDLVGLSSRSYFSKVFKERYGVSPNTILH